MADLIERQAAIDALDKHIDTFDAIDTNYLSGLRTAMSILKEMPSAQPETHDKRTETHECDLINRQQAIDALNDEYHGMISDESMKIYQIINWILALPSAQPERKKGKWLVDEDGNMECPFCGNTCGFGNYCNECGADLRGERNEID